MYVHILYIQVVATYYVLTLLVLLDIMTNFSQDVHVEKEEGAHCNCACANEFLHLHS